MIRTHCPHRHPVHHLVGTLYACINVRGRIGVWRDIGYWQNEPHEATRELAKALLEVRQTTGGGAND